MGHEKICTVCKEAKPVSAFHRNALNKDGFNVRCKVCRKSDSSKYYARHGDEILLKVKEYAKTPARKAWYEEYYKLPSTKAAILKRKRTPEYKRKEKARSQQPEAKAVAQARYRKNKHKWLAYGAVAQAVRSGLLSQVSNCVCSDCGVQAQNYHHHQGYDEPHWLTVVALCSHCHHLRHYPS